MRYSLYCSYNATMLIDFTSNRFIDSCRPSCLICVLDDRQGSVKQPLGMGVCIIDDHVITVRTRLHAVLRGIHCTKLLLDLLIHQALDQCPQPARPTRLFVLRIAFQTPQHVFPYAVHLDVDRPPYVF